MFGIVCNLGAHHKAIFRHCLLCLCSNQLSECTLAMTVASRRKFLSCFSKSRIRAIYSGPSGTQHGGIMRPQQILEILQDRNNQEVRIRCTSGSEYTITDLFQWWFQPNERVLTLVLDGRRTVLIDPMLVESAETVARDDAGRA